MNVHRLRVLLAVVVVALVFGLPGIVPTGAAQSSTVLGLGGTTLESPVPNASGSCNDFSFAPTGTASGTYAGTFSEFGSVSLAPADANLVQAITGLTASFSIDSPAGQVTGTKWLEPGANPLGNPDTGSCQALFSGTRYTVSAWNLRYEATIVTPDGQTCTTVGYSILSLNQNSSVLVDRFSETFYNDVNNPPVCTGGGGGEQPPAEPVVKEDCMAGGWDAYGFKNQGQCIKFVNQRDT